MIKTIVFDLDGTLVDSYPAILESLNCTLRHFHLPEVDSQKIRRMVGRGLENLLLQVIDPSQLQEGVRVFKNSYDETVSRGTFLLPDVAETLTNLHAAGAKMAVASNKPAEYSRMILRELKLDHVLPLCFGPNEQIPPKPEPTMLRTIMSELNSAPGETLYVGDMALDVGTARNAQVLVALVPGGGDEVETLREAKPDFLLQRFSDLCELVEARPAGS